MTISGKFTWSILFSFFCVYACEVLNNIIFVQILSLPLQAQSESQKLPASDSVFSSLRKVFLVTFKCVSVSDPAFLVAFVCPHGSPKLHFRSNSQQTSFVAGARRKHVSLSR